MPRRKIQSCVKSFLLSFENLCKCLWNGRLSGGGWPLLLGRTEEGKFKNARIILHNAVDYFDGWFSTRRNTTIAPSSIGRQRSRDSLWRSHWWRTEQHRGGAEPQSYMVAVCRWQALFLSFAGPGPSFRRTRPGRGRANERRDRSFTRLASIMPVENVCALGIFFAWLISFCHPDYA